MYSAKLFTQLGLINQVASVLDRLVNFIESAVVHVNLVCMRTETADEVHLLALLVDSGTMWNSDVLDSIETTIFSPS